MEKQKVIIKKISGVKINLFLGIFLSGFYNFLSGKKQTYSK